MFGARLVKRMAGWAWQESYSSTPGVALHSVDILVSPWLHSPYLPMPALAPVPP